MKTYNAGLVFQERDGNPYLSVEFVRKTYPLEHTRFLFPIIRESQTSYWLDFDNAKAEGVSDFQEVCKLRNGQTGVLRDLERACLQHKIQDFAKAFSNKKKVREEVFGKKKRISFKSGNGIDSPGRVPGTKRAKGCHYGVRGVKD
jgi:hypothetical protein